MFLHRAFAAAVVVFGVFALGFSTKPSSIAGSWQVDPRHSDAQLTTDGTTDFEHKKITVTLGFGRLSGGLNFDDADPAKSTVELHIYPATGMSPSIAEDGNFKAYWLANLANHTLLCFHSKKIVRTADGRLQVTGELVVTRVDRNVEATPNEGYAGPVYGPPIVHRISHEATFVFDALDSENKRPPNGAIEASASTKVFREDFPQLVRTVVSTYWPPVIQDRNCEQPGPSEAYSGSKCTGTFLQGPSLPEPTGTQVGEDYPGPQNFNSIVAERINITLHMRLLAKGSGEPMAAGN